MGAPTTSTRILGGKKQFLRKSVLTLANCKRCAASSGEPLRLPCAQPSMSAVFCGQVLVSTESATSGQSISYLSVCQCATRPARESRVCSGQPRTDENKSAHLFLHHCLATLHFFLSFFLSWFIFENPT